MLFEMIGYSARNFAVNQTAKLNCGLLKTKLSSLAGPPPLTALSSRRTITPCNKRKIDTECIFNRCIRCLYFTTIREIVQNKALNLIVGNALCKVRYYAKKQGKTTWFSRGCPASSLHKNHLPRAFSHSRVSVFVTQDGVAGGITKECFSKARRWVSILALA